MSDADAAFPGAEAFGRIASVRDSPNARLSLMSDLYESPGQGESRQLPYRRAAMAFMRWQVDRGLLNPIGKPGNPPGSPWWRAVNERLLLDTTIGRAAYAGAMPQPLTTSSRLAFEFAVRPSAVTWYRAHNASIAAGYLDHRSLAENEGRVERFFINLILVRVLYAHALVASPKIALSWLGPLGPLLGDPRVGMTSMFLSLYRVLPSSYPVGDDLERFGAQEHGFGRLLDVGVIRPRIRTLFEWSAEELDLPGLLEILVDDVPAYAWDASDRAIWDQSPSLLARTARRVLPPQAR